MKNKKIVLAVTGGIAAYKTVYLLRLLKNAGTEVQVIGTKSSLNLIGAATWEALSGKTPLFDTWETPDSSKISHIMLAQEVNLIIVAPATANIIGKAATGIADDLVSTVLMAATAPVLFAPGMNSEMYKNPAVVKNIETLKNNRNIHFTECGYGKLACNDTGTGRMAEPEEIFKKALNILTPKKSNGFKWLIAAGSTREYIDPIRYITNGSSGKTGLAIARAVANMGGDVQFVAGNISNVKNENIAITNVVSASEMAEAVMSRAADCDILVMSAAVADYSPEKRGEKLKKGKDDISLTLHRTKDILQETKKIMAGNKVRIGFAAETSDLMENARKKLKQKGLDLVVANLVGAEFNPFGSDKNSVVLVYPEGVEEIPMTDKNELGRIIAEKIFVIAESKLLEKQQD